VATVLTIRRGNAAEAAVLNAFVRAGLAVFVPFGDGHSFDLVVGLPDERLLRVQVKASRVRNGCVEFNSSSTDHGRGTQSYLGRADLLGVYCQDLDQVFVLPVEECAAFRGYLRLAPTANNQRRRVRFASDFTLETWLATVGMPPDGSKTA
jgi:hypothetical protein